MSASMTPPGWPTPKSCPSKAQADTAAFLERALDWLARHGAAVQWVVTDNGSAYRSKVFAAALRRAGLRDVRTRPYTPRTNGKSRRLIQTSLRECAYAQPYRSSAERSLAIAPWANAYNLTRPHSGNGHLSPRQRLNNLLGNDTWASSAKAKILAMHWERRLMVFQVKSDATRSPERVARCARPIVRPRAASCNC